MLRWHLDHGDKLEQYRKYEELTGEQPHEAQGAPELHSWNRFAWNGFHALTGSRQWTMAGAAPIPYSELTAWLDEMGIAERDERDELLRMIREMDQAYLEWGKRDKA